DLPAILKEVVLSKRGLVIVVGGTGSGKSTTLATMVGYRNERTRGHIVTIEDPVEYVHQHKGCVITHREVGVDTESWHNALKNTLRQAPDVILIGEIRDRETMEYGIQFAETGHLVLATLHANSSNQALDRIINFFPDERREQLLMDMSLNIRALVSQRLIPRESGSGRIAAMEIMLASPLIQDLIFKGEVAKIKEVMARSTQRKRAEEEVRLQELPVKTGAAGGGNGRGRGSGRGRPLSGAGQSPIFVPLVTLTLFSAACYNRASSASPHSARFLKARSFSNPTQSLRVFVSYG
ncbi:MAG: Flp pilus assembly complex ATPase component TadA, partial [Caldilineales bacterium]|nr:Flp pilus assembly complex ATPase component TadA [Caldilineales bacterium]